MRMEIKKVKEIAQIQTGKYDVNHSSIDGSFTFYTCAMKPFKSDTYSFEGASIILPGNGANVGQVFFSEKHRFEAYQRTYVINKIQAYPRYVFYYFKKNWEISLKNKQYGSATNYIRYDNIANFNIPLPHPKDQIRIAGILFRTERLIEKRKECIRLLDEFLRSTFLEMFGDPVRNEKGWEKKRIKEIAVVRIGPFGSLLHSEDYVENEIPLINPSHIIDGEIVPTKILTITLKKFKELKSYQLKINDVVVARRGEIGRCAVVRTLQPLFCGTGSMFIRIISEYSPLLLQYQIYNTSLKEYLESKAKGVTMKNLNSTTLGNLPILLPPLALQTQFVDIIEKIEAIKTKYTQSLTDLENLYGSLSQRAFKGELNLD